MLLHQPYGLQQRFEEAQSLLPTIPPPQVPMRVAVVGLGETITHTGFIDVGLAVVTDMGLDDAAVCGHDCC